MERSWSIDRAAGIALVRCRLHNDRDVPRKVRVESLLDGPVLPPRRNGVPEAGWDRSGVTMQLDPGERRAVGFAVPTDPNGPIGSNEGVGPDESTDQDDSPVAITETEPDDTGTAAGGAAAIRRLGTHRPPADVVARIDGDVTGRGGECDVTGRGGEHDRSYRSVECGMTPKAESDADESDGAESDEAESNEDEVRDGNGAGGRKAEARATVSDSIEADRIEEWLDTVEARIERGERLTGATLAEATAEVDDAGGLEPLLGLDERLADDATLLRRFGDRMTALATRAEATDVPIDAMEELA